MTEAQTSNYWISPNALRITLNAMGLKDYIQCSATSGAVIMCFMRDIDGLDYDAGHNYRRWPLSTAPTFFNSTTHKYVYVAIPRNSAVASNAQLAFPSEKIDIYGYTEKIVPVRDINGNMLDENGNITTDINKAAKTTEPDKQIGDPSYYYIFLQGIISASVSEGGADQMREWEEGHTLNYGSLSTDQATKEVDGTWWRYLADDDKVEFLKTITNAVIDKLHVIKEFIVDSAAQFKSSVSIGGALSVAGNATINGLLTAYNAIINTIRSANFTGTGMADSGFQITNTWSGTNDSGAVFDYLTIRKKMVIQSLEIKETHFSAGDLAQSCATAEIIRTDYIDGNGNVIGYSEQVVPWKKLGVWFMLRKVLSGNQKLGIFSLRKKIRITLTHQQLNSVKRVRCYFLAEDGDRKIENWWRVNDLARCQTINVVGGTRETYAGKDSYQGNIYWWRKVMAVSANTGEPSYKWADDEGNLYDTQREGTHRYKNYNGARKGETGDYAHTESYGDAVTIDGKKCHWFDVACDFAYEDGSRTNWCDANSDLPAAGDKVVQFGNTEDPDRMNVTVSEINGVGNPDAPSIKIYRGIYTFDPSLSWWGGNARKMKLSPSAGYEFYGPMFKFVQEYGIARVPLMRPEQYWNNVAFQRDDEYRQNYPDYSDDIKNPNGTFKSRADGHTDKRYVRKLYYYDEITHNGSLWIANFAEEYYWRLTQSISGVGVAGDRISDNDYAGLTEAQKATCERVRSYTTQEPSASATDWKIAVEKGDAGSFKSRAFCRINTDISGITPTGGNYNHPVPVASTVGSETVTWTDGVPQGDAILWSTVCTFYGDGTSSGWSHPAPETDTATLDIEFSPSQTEPNPPSGNTPFSDHSAEGWYDPSALPVGQTMIWRAERKVSNGVYDGEWVVTRIYGEKGDPGVSITKTGETYRYATNNTGVRPAADDPGWSATKPTLQAGYWLFTETTIHWSDNSTTVLYTDERNPNDGKPGMDIVAGTTTITYCVKDSNSPQPADSEFKPYAQIVSQIVPGKWLWSKATTPYYKGSTSGESAGSSSNYNVSYIGTNGKNITKIGEINVYQVSNNGTTIPTGTWFDEAHKPTPAQGEYLWTRTTITWSDNSTTVLYAAERNPNDGEPGTSISISNQSVTYSKQTSGNLDPSTLTYGNYPSSLAKGDWLYSKTTVIYSDGTHTDSYSVSYIGEDGAPGSAGKGISSITEYYAVNNDKNNAPADSEFSTSVPATWDINHRYLWNYEETVYTTGSPAKTAKQVIAIFTKNGRGIDSITNHYLATSLSSGVTKQTSGWTTAVQAVTSSNRYLWNYETINYVDGTPATSETDPHIIGVYGDSITAQYAPNDNPTAAQIHTTFQDGDKYMRTISSSDTSWSAWQKIVGESGENGDYIDSSFGISSQLTTANVNTAPSDISSWSDAPVATTAAKPYLWCRQISHTFNDGTETTGTPSYFRMTGEMGPQGAAGRAIVSVTEYYKATNSNSPMPAPTTDTGWDTDPNLSAQGMDPWNESHKYLWNYEKVEYSSGTQFERTIPQILAIWTKNGENGKGIDSITNYYQVSSSSTPHKRMSDPGYDPSVDGTWDDNPTAPGNGQYLWNYEMITWIMPDGSNTYTYTDVQMIGYAGDIIFEVSAYKAFASAPQNDKPTEINSITPASTDFGNGWYSTPPTGTTNQIWVSKATVQNGTVVGGLSGWSNPSPWSGTNGTDGITVTVSPSAILLTQSETAPYTVNCGVDSTSNAFAVTIMAIRDNLPLALSNASVVSSTRCTGRCSIVNIGYGPSGEQALIVNGAIKAWVRDVNIANQNNNGSFIISFMAGGKLLSVTIPWYANLLGTWKQSVENGVEKSIAQKTSYIFFGDTVHEIEQTGAYVRGWEENTSRIERTTARVNLFGTINNSWTIDDEHVEPDRGWLGTEDYNDDLISPGVTLEKDITYCLSWYSSINDLVPHVNGSSGQSLTSITELTTDKYEGCNRYYVTFTPSVTSIYHFVFFDRSEEQSELIGLPMLEIGTTPSVVVVESSVITQKANEIDLGIRAGLRRTGINIQDGLITLDAETTQTTGTFVAPQVVSRDEERGMQTIITAGTVRIESLRSNSYGFFGLNEDGEVVLQLFDKNGATVATLGGTPGKMTPGAWNDLYLKPLGSSVPSSIDDCVAPLSQCELYYKIYVGTARNGSTYKYFDPSGNEISSSTASSINGKVYVNKDYSGSYIPDGWYVERNDGTFPQDMSSGTARSYCTVCYYQNGQITDRQNVYGN